ncbi:LIPH isoform 5 [Pan troglodytes]|uniref:LIPH isoform 5 n=1 Tax=Pan troglodytes TaxID=9598 RepID=A0A2J8M5T3_PANTR|nr:LIPH isoform 5 [Pan troglodytes]
MLRFYLFISLMCLSRSDASLDMNEESPLFEEGFLQSEIWEIKLIPPK